MSNPNLTATAGTVATTSPLLEVPALPLAGRRMKVSGAGCAVSASGASIKLSCPSFAVNNQYSVSAGATLTGTGELRITGALSATASLADGKVVPASSVPAPLGS